MPKRIGFHVIYATSEVADHPASELGWAGPASRGWRSSPGARAPHELVLQLPVRTALTRVQLLAHQHLIPERIELLVHDSVGGAAGSRTPSSPQYEAAGWVALAPPAPMGSEAARELRTAAVPRRPARYVRLRLMQPHESENNPHGQVALMGVNIFGFELGDEDGSDSEAALAKLADTPLGEEQYSPYDDLAFIMYVDNEIADVIRQLETKKQAAILSERFEYARKLKSACGALGAGGRVLGALQLQKRLAAAAEQYERATRRRDAIASARARLATAVRLPVLLEPDGPDPRNDEYSVDDAPFSIDMISHPSAKLNLEVKPSPSPPGGLPKACTATAQADRPQHPTPQAEPQPQLKTIMDDNRIYFVSGCDESLTPKNAYNNGDNFQNNAKYNDPYSNTQKSHTVEDISEDNIDNRAMSPYTNEHVHRPQENVNRNVTHQGHKMKHSAKEDDARCMSPYASDHQENGQRSKSFHQGTQSIGHKMQHVAKSDVIIDDGNRSMSPYGNEMYVEKVERGQENGHRGISFHQGVVRENGYDGGGKMYFEDRGGQSVGDDYNANGGGRFGHPQGSNLGNGKDKHEYGSGGGGSRISGAACDGSYFSSPANSVSPTNANYGADSNGVSSRPMQPLGSGTMVGAVKRRNRSAGPAPPAHHRSSYEAYEERLVPALRHSHTNEYLRGCQAEGATESRGRSKLGERERKQAALPILIFGEHLVEKIYSKHFAEKEEGLQNLKSELRGFGGKTGGSGAALSPNKAARAATLLLHRALRDPVFSVYSLAAELTRVFFTDFITERVSSAEVTRSVERLVPELLVRAGEPAPRVHSLAMHTLLTMADCQSVRSLGLIPAYLVRPLTAGTAPRLALSRLLMVEQLLLNHGIDKNSGLRARAVAELGAGGLTHGQGAVRRAAERLLLAAYERAPRLVRTQLPPDDPVTRRNLLYRHLFEGFDRIDRRKQEEMMGNSQCEDMQTSRSSQFMGDRISPKMTDSSMMMTMSQMSVSQMSGSMTSSMSSMTSSLHQPRSSLRKPSSKKYQTSVGFNGVKNDTEYPGYNKLRLDSAVSPKHQPKVTKTAHNPRNYVLEKNWQNSVMQNGNYCPQQDVTNKIKDVNSYTKRYHSNYDDIPENMSNLSKSNNVSNGSLNSCLPNSKQGSVTSLNNFNTAQNGPLHPYSKSGIVARNLHSSIVFDNRAYSDSENTNAIENNVKKMHIGDKNVDSIEDCSDKRKNKVNGVHGSPVGSLKRNKNIKNVIYRSKSGSNVPTCFDDDNFDSFDDSQVDLEHYEYCKAEAECREAIEQEQNEMRHDVEYHSDASTPEVGEKGDGGVDGEGQCPFCLGCVAEGALDSHYWRACPLLARCPACRAPLELRALSQHLTEDCIQSGSYQLCGRCTEAISVDIYQRHLTDDNCLETAEGFWKCPLCHTNVHGDDDSWRQHLAGQGPPHQPSCTSNPRLPPIAAAVEPTEHQLKNLIKM